MKIKADDSSSIRLYTSPIKDDDETSKTVIRHIVEFEEKMDMLAERFGMNVIQDFDGEGTLSIEDSVGIVEPITTRRTINEDDGEGVLAHRLSQKKDVRMGFDRGVLTLASNTGCYRKLFLKYFDTEAKPLKSVNHCCENCCTNPSDIPLEIRQLLSPDSYQATSMDLDDNNPQPPRGPPPGNAQNGEDADAEEDEQAEEEEAQDSEEDIDDTPSRTNTRTPGYLAVAALSRIYKFREEIYKQALGNNATELALLGPDLYLSDAEVRLIAKSVANISQPIHLCRYLPHPWHQALCRVS